MDITNFPGLGRGSPFEDRGPAPSAPQVYQGMCQWCAALYNGHFIDGPHYQDALLNLETKQTDVQAMDDWAQQLHSTLPPGAPLAPGMQPSAPSVSNRALLDAFSKADVPTILNVLQTVFGIANPEALLTQAGFMSGGQFLSTRLHDFLDKLEFPSHGSDQTKECIDTIASSIKKADPSAQNNAIHQLSRPTPTQQAMAQDIKKYVSGNTISQAFFQTQLGRFFLEYGGAGATNTNYQQMLAWLTGVKATAMLNTFAGEDKATQAAILASPAPPASTPQQEAYNAILKDLQSWCAGDKVNSNFWSTDLGKLLAAIKPQPSDITSLASVSTWLNSSGVLNSFLTDSWSATDAAIKSSGGGTPPSTDPLTPSQAQPIYNEIDKALSNYNTHGDHIDAAFWNTALGKFLLQQGFSGDKTSFSAVETWLKAALTASETKPPSGAIYAFYNLPSGTQTADIKSAPGISALSPSAISQYMNKMGSGGKGILGALQKYASDFADFQQTKLWQFFVQCGCTATSYTDCLSWLQAQPGLAGATPAKGMLVDFSELSAADEAALINSAPGPTPPTPLTPSQAQPIYDAIDKALTHYNTHGDHIDAAFWNTDLGKFLLAQGFSGDKTSLAAVETWLKAALTASEANPPSGAIYTFYKLPSATQTADINSAPGISALSSSAIDQYMNKMGTAGTGILGALQKYAADFADFQKTGLWQFFVQCGCKATSYADCLSWLQAQPGLAGTTPAKGMLVDFSELSATDEAALINSAPGPGPSPIATAMEKDLANYSDGKGGITAIFWQTQLGRFLLEYASGCPNYPGTGASLKTWDTWLESSDVGGMIDQFAKESPGLQTQILASAAAGAPTPQQDALKQITDDLKLWEDTGTPPAINDAFWNTGLGKFLLTLTGLSVGQRDNSTAVNDWLNKTGVAGFLGTKWSDGQALIDSAGPSGPVKPQPPTISDFQHRMSTAFAMYIDGSGHLDPVFWQTQLGKFLLEYGTGCPAMTTNAAQLQNWLLSNADGQQQMINRCNDPQIFPLMTHIIATGHMYPQQDTYQRILADIATWEGGSPATINQDFWKTDLGKFLITNGQPPITDAQKTNANDFTLWLIAQQGDIPPTPSSGPTGAIAAFLSSDATKSWSDAEAMIEAAAEGTPP